jgi:hypothetical protein
MSCAPLNSFDFHSFRPCTHFFAFGLKKEDKNIQETSSDKIQRFKEEIDGYNDLIELAKDDVLEGATPSFSGKFKSNYVTAWFDDERYVQLKSFLRSYFVIKEVESTTYIKLNIYKNYNEAVPSGGTRIINLTPTVRSEEHTSELQSR